MLYVPVVFLLCCTFTSLVRAPWAVWPLSELTASSSAPSGYRHPAAVSVAATKGLQLVFAVLR